MGSEQLADWKGNRPLIEFGPETDKAAGPFMDTAAIMRNLDLVITSDTSLPHLAGALGVPVWMALNFCSDWRWLEEREDSPWYPTMRVFRQTRFGDWQGVFERIAAELTAVIGGDGARLRCAAAADAGTSPVPSLDRLKTYPTSSLDRLKTYPTAGFPLAVPTAPGELLDKIAILEIKRERIPQEGKKRNVCVELEQLCAVRDGRWQ